MSQLRKNLVPVIAGVVVIAVVIIFLTRSSDDGYTVKAEFKDVNGLRKNSDVKIGGVPGGKITKIELTGRDTGLVTMKLRDGVFPIGTGATADSRPVNLLGEKFVDLNPGDPKHPEQSGATIPIKDTGTPAELDDVLNMLDPTTRGRLRVLINEAGIGIAGRDSDINALLDRLPPSLRETQQLVSSFATDTDRLKRLASEGDRVIGELADGKDDVTAFVDTAERTLKNTTANRENLGRTLDGAPGTIRQLRATLDQLGTASARLRPAARKLRATSKPLAGTLARLPQFADDAEPTLRAVRETSPTLDRLGRRGAPIVARLEPTARELSRFSTIFNPFSKTLDNQTNPLLTVMEGWARTIQTRDNAGHLFRTEAIPDEEVVTGLLGRLLTHDQQNRPQSSGPAAIANGDPLPGTPDRSKPPVAAPKVGTPTTTPQAPATPGQDPGKGSADGVADLLDYLLR
jgi:virulence factor Mce-like protein